MKAPKPLTGPGSRQPTLKLPTVMPDGKRTKLHPLTWCIKNRMQPGDNKSALALQHMGVVPQSLYKWEKKCEADRNFPLPLQRAVQLAAYFSVPRSLFRPDVFGRTA